MEISQKCGILIDNERQWSVKGSGRREKMSDQEGNWYMSQEKVNRYKEQKKNKKAIQAKKKRDAMLAKLGGGLVVLVLAAWIGYSAVDSYQTKQNSGTVTADITALDEYMTSLTAEE